MDTLRFPVELRFIINSKLEQFMNWFEMSFHYQLDDRFTYKGTEVFLHVSAGGVIGYLQIANESNPGNRTVEEKLGALVLFQPVPISDTRLELLIWRDKKCIVSAQYLTLLLRAINQTWPESMQDISRFFQEHPELAELTDRTNDLACPFESTSREKLIFYHINAVTGSNLEQLEHKVVGFESKYDGGRKPKMSDNELQYDDYIRLTLRETDSATVGIIEFEDNGPDGIVLRFRACSVECRDYLDALVNYLASLFHLRAKVNWNEASVAPIELQEQKETVYLPESEEAREGWGQIWAVFKELEIEYFNMEAPEEHRQPTYKDVCAILVDKGIMPPKPRKYQYVLAAGKAGKLEKYKP